MELLNTGYQRAGKASQINADNTELAFGSWDVTIDGQDLETTNFESYTLATDTTYREGILGAIVANLRYGGDWDAHANPLDDPPGMYPRDDFPNLEFVVNQGDATQWTFDYSRIRSSVSGATWDGLVTFEVTGMSQGGFDMPAGSV